MWTLGCLPCLPRPAKRCLEEAVAEVWCRVLGLPDKSIQLCDNFVELGGESLLALRACASLRYLLGKAEEDDGEDGEFGHVSGAFAVSELLRATDLGAYCAALRRSGHDLPGGTCPSTFTGAEPRPRQLELENARREVGFGPLHAAAQSNAVETVQLLLERRARATAVEPGAQMTAMHYAAMCKDSGALELLLASKAPVTVRDARGQSLVHAAARSGSVQCLRLLLAQGGRKVLEWSDRWARSAVHWAVLNGHPEALELLLAARANPRPKAITAHQMAKRTHLTQEQPLDLAQRVHGKESQLARILRLALEEEEDEPLDADKAQYMMTLSQGGLDRLALWELRTRLSAKRVKREQCRIFFATDCLPAAVASLKSAEKVCAVVLRADGQRLADVLQGPDPLAQVAAWIAEAPGWARAVGLWRRFNEGEGEGALSFKITCRRSGSRFAALSSQNLAVAAAARLQAALGWRPQVRRPDLEVRILVSDSDLLVDLPLLFQAALKSGGSEICCAGMSAPVAWAMARSAELQVGDRVLDPMCGKAVILVEAAVSWPQCHFLGCDLDAAQLVGAAQNAQLLAAHSATHLAGAGRVELLHGDAARLPLADGAVDVLICDIPFGRQYGTIEGCRESLYKAIFREFHRVVDARKGRLVLISSLEQEPYVLAAAGFQVEEGRCPGAEPHAWRCHARRELKLGFLDARLLVLHRPGDDGGEVPEVAKRLWWETSAGRGDWASLKVSERPPMQRTRGREI
ncbi:unnamed protein product [Effrenium voratum]|nr:unnamed protein product [Effrenium voratum]